MAKRKRFWRSALLTVSHELWKTLDWNRHDLKGCVWWYTFDNTIAVRRKPRSWLPLTYSLTERTWSISSFRIFRLHHEYDSYSILMYLRMFLPLWAILAFGSLRVFWRSFTGKGLYFRRTMTNWRSILWWSPKMVDFERLIAAMSCKKLLLCPILIHMCVCCFSNLGTLWSSKRAC